MIGPVSSSQPIWTQFVPNSILQHVAQGVVGWRTQGESNLGSSYTTVLNSVLASMAENGKLPTPNQLQGLRDPANAPALRDMIAQANNLTFILWLGRTAASGVSPVSVSLERAGLQFTQMAQDYINKAGGNVTQGLDNMTRAHPNLVPSEVYMSASSAGVTGFSETAGAQNWITSNKALVEKYPTASYYLMPNQNNKGAFSQSAYQMELAMGLRHKLTPIQFLDQIYIAAGNAYYFDNLDPQIKTAIKADPGLAHQVYAKADAAVTAYGNSVNPIWGQYWASNQSKTAKAQVVIQLRTMLADPSTPKTELATHIGYLVNAYDQFQGEKTNGHMTSTQLRTQWAGLMAQAQERYPDTKTVIQSVFAGLG